MKSIALVVACTAFVAGVVEPGDAAETISPGGPDAGLRIVTLGSGRDAPACASCHGFDGNADPSGAFPRLAGQSAAYLRHALDQFADGRRFSPMMKGIAKSLTEQQRNDVSVYYAALHSIVPPSAEADASLIEKGRFLATLGSDGEQIPACANCHGPFGRSATPPIPSLAGQYSNYIVGQLEGFRKGHRGVKHGSMQAVAHAITRPEMEAVASYFQRISRPAASPVAPVSAR